MKAVLDTSAILALMWREPGHEIVARHLTNGGISTVNLAEIYAKCSERGIDLGAVQTLLASFQLGIVPFDERQALISGQLRQQTRASGLSLGDRACLALGVAKKASVITADRQWLEQDLNLEIVSIR